MEMKKVREMMEKVGIPGTDQYERIPSKKTFPDGANFRVEVSAVESASILKATIDEGKKLGIPLHRVIAMCRGATLSTREQLVEFAKVAEDNGVEVIIFPGPRPAWYTGRLVSTPAGAFAGLRLRGSDNIAHYLADVMRCLEIGYKGFLVWDEGVLWMLNEMKKNGDIPEDVIFKISVFAGHANPAGAKLMESLGAGTLNPVADISIEALGAIRKVINIPMDVHIQFFDSAGGMNRMYEAADIAYVASPVYFKMEPGPGTEMFLPWRMSDESNAELCRFKMRCVKNIYEIIQNAYIELKGSNWGPAGLRIPKTK
jgi:hypothetical protein